ncbi:carbohydrate ABC transporter permease [Thalassospira sp. MCCC 1A01428]|uniref:carbohydrate ABC transporter permease n=1 Tax=Thalassospira sp. MCCC 1A01428 TaxID=1470575 RepID=UPI000A1EC929|nr:sugar ABC transporter permease [Thalassospira sp. MCCC 1A01428]OSQ41188.1 sugar ABC transporter permease [Thalassospira sp. MCCC 1A01428]
MKRKTRMWSNLSAKIASVPMLVTAIGVFVLCVVYSIALSFTRSRYFPKFDFIGFDQYVRLWTTDRWTVSVSNLLIFGLLFVGFCLLLGFLLAVMLDRNIRMEGVFRTTFLYPYALSFVVTGLIWQWMMDPALGIQNVVRNMGWESFSFAPLTSTTYAIYGVVIAAVWQGTGLIMCLMLAGLRGVDREIWKAARVDGIPLWRTYIFIIIPMIRPVIVTSVVLLSISVVRVYDLVVAQTGGGPGIATEVPAKFVIDHFTERGNVAIAMAAATMMLLPVLLLVGPWVYNEYVRRVRA